MRDAVSWMLPVLWPIKILTLPMRGPYPSRKGEARLTMRLIEDVELPAVMAQAPMRDTPSEISPSSIPSTYMLVRPSPTILVTRGLVRVSEQESSAEPPVKSDAGSDLLPAIKAVLEGKRFVSASLAGHFVFAATLSTATQTMVSSVITLMLGVR